MGVTAAFAQIPAEGINYQAVARNAQGNTITSPITVRVSILSGSAGGPVQYQETHSVTPNVYGIFNLTIGQGTPTNGTFPNINWGTAAHFAKTEINTGSGYIDMGTSQLWAVPYALYAETSGNSGTTYTAGSGINIAGTTISAVDNSVSNELQNLSVTGATLSISNGNSVTLPTGTTYTAGTGINIAGNVISATGGGTDSQTLSLAGNTLSISNGNSVTLPAGTGTDSQTLTLAGNTLSISNGNSVTLPAGTTYTAGSGISITGSTIAATDNSITNEIQNLTLAGTTLSISGGNSVTLPTGTTYTAGSGINITGNTIAATDNSITNEIQSLTLTGTTLSISGGNSVTLPAGTTYTAGAGITITGTTIAAADASATNEIQSLTLSGNTLSISGGNSITLPASSGGGTLDQAYDFGGAGAGKTITADSGPVTINGSGTGAGNIGLLVSHSGSNTAAVGVNFGGTGNAIQAISTNPANGFATIQASTNSSNATNSALFGQSTGAARAVSGQVEASATADVAVRGLNLRTNGGIGVEGVGFNGVSGATSNVGGFGVFGSNTATGATGNPGSLAVGTYGAGFNGVFGQTNDVALGYAGYFTADLGVEGTGYSLGGWQTVSDRRLKTNIVPITGAMDKLMQVNGTHYTITTRSTNLLTADGKATFSTNSREQYGVIAQDLELIFPEMIKEKAIFANQGDQTVYKTVDYIQLVPVLIEAIKELKLEVETLKAEINNK